MARTLTINITDISLRPYGLTSPLALEFPAFDRFDSRTEFSCFDGMTHLAVAFKVSNLRANDCLRRKSHHTFWVNVVDRASDAVISSRTVYVEMQPWEEDGLKRVDIPLRMSQIVENRFYYVNIIAPGYNNRTPIIYKEFRMVKIDRLLPADFFTPEWGAVMKKPFSSQREWPDVASYEERYITVAMPKEEYDLFGSEVEHPLYVSFLLKKHYGAVNLDPEIIARIVGDTGERYEERAAVYDYDYLGNNVIAPDELLVQVPVSRSMGLGSYFYVELHVLGCPVAGAIFDVDSLCEEIEGELSGEDIRPIYNYTDSKGIDIIVNRRYEFEQKKSALSAQPEEEAVEVIETRLDSLTGLDGVKEKVATYRSLVEFNRRRELLGLPVSGFPLHCMFLGAPGTGKTTVAKILGEILHECGVLSKGHVVVHERSTLLGQYYSSEGENVRKAIEEARGGVLFIDEAYQLYQPSDPKDPGRFVLETLMTALADEENRDWMLILAGYTEPMMRLFNVNPGLRSRIPETNFYVFDDFTESQLMEIAEGYLSRRKFELTDEARELLRSRLQADYAARDKDFGNARHVVNLIETGIFPAMARRLSGVKSPTAGQLSLIEASDIPTAAPAVPRRITPRPGFRMRG